MAQQPSSKAKTKKSQQKGIDFAPQKSQKISQPKTPKPTKITTSNQPALARKSRNVTISDQPVFSRPKAKKPTSSQSIQVKFSPAPKSKPKNIAVQSPKSASKLNRSQNSARQNQTQKAAKFGINVKSKQTKLGAKPSEINQALDTPDDVAPKKLKKNQLIFRIIRFVTAGLLALSAVLVLVTLISSRLVPDKFVLIGSAVIALWTIPVLATLLRKRERAITSIILSLLALIFSTAHILAFTYLNSTEGFLSSLDQDHDSSVDSTTPVGDVLNTPFLVYISGKDSTDSLSDVNQLMAINPGTHKILILNTPRDYYVQLASHPAPAKKDKLTHAGTFGLNESIRTMELLYDIEINYYVQINFDSLIKLVDTIGGITVNSSYAFEEFKVGDNNLNGAQTLRFSRNRKSFSGGDRTRGENQQRVINAIIQKLSSPNTLANYPSILDSMKGSFITNFGSDNISKFAKAQIDQAKPWKVETYSVNGIGILDHTYSYPNEKLYVMIPDEETVKSAKMQMDDILR